MQTKDLGSFFVHSIRLKKRSAIVHRAKTHEIEVPFRISDSWVFRICGEWGFVLGFWRKQDNISEEDALIAALQGHEVWLLDNNGHVLTEFEPELESESEGAVCEPT